MFLTPWVTRLLLANGVAFLAAPPGSAAYRALWFVPMFAPQAPWTAISYMFLHAGIWHLAFNMIGLLFFGPRLEQRLGAKRFLILYFLSGLGGAAFSLVFEPRAAVVGASAAVMGVLLAFAFYWPRETVLVWGIIPLQIRTLVVILVVTSVFFGLSGTGGRVAHFAHLGGLVFGYLYLKWLAWRRRVRIDTANAVPPRSRFGVPGRVDRARLDRWRRIDPAALHSLNRKEVEELLQRLDADGAGSLSQDEQAFLDRMAPL